MIYVGSDNLFAMLYVGNLAVITCALSLSIRSNSLIKMSKNKYIETKCKAVKCTPISLCSVQMYAENEEQLLGKF